MYYNYTSGREDENVTAIDNKIASTLLSPKSFACIMSEPMIKIFKITICNFESDDWTQLNAQDWKIYWSWRITNHEARSQQVGNLIQKDCVNCGYWPIKGLH